MLYHQRTFERLLRMAVPKPDPILVDSLPPLPASVREWYSLSESVNWLAHYSNGDWAIDPKDFDEHIMTIRPDWRVCFADDLPRAHSIDNSAARVFLVENQGVCWWAFTDQQDDPPVYVTYRPPPEDWKLTADRFSIFIYTRIFDRIRFFVDGLFHSEVTDTVPHSAFNYLDARFEKEPTTQHLEGWQERRWSRGEQRVTISGQFWMLSADTLASFQRLGHELADFLEEFPQ
jgi:hypothetical protein